MGHIFCFSYCIRGHILKTHIAKPTWHCFLHNSLEINDQGMGPWSNVIRYEVLVLQWITIIVIQPQRCISLAFSEEEVVWIVCIDQVMHSDKEELGSIRTRENTHLANSAFLVLNIKQQNYWELSTYPANSIKSFLHHENFNSSRTPLVKMIYTLQKLINLFYQLFPVMHGNQCHFSDQWIVLSGQDPHVSNSACLH